MEGERIKLNMVEKRGKVKKCMNGKRINIDKSRRKKIIKMRVMKKEGVEIKIKGIYEEVLIREKLKWVEEDRKKSKIVLKEREEKKIKMEIMEIKNSRKEEDIFEMMNGRRKRMEKLIDGVDDMNGVIMKEE